VKTIVVGVNTLTAVDQAIYSNHSQFWFRLGRNMPDYNFILCNPRRMSIDSMRNMAAKIAVENNADLMFIDDDVLIPKDFTLQRLIACDADIAAGWTIIRGYPFKNMIFVFDNEEKTSLTHWTGPEKTGILPCDAVGFSCVLIKHELLKLVEPPYFVTGPHNTEDIYFCMKALQTKPGCKIVVDLDIKTSHNVGAEYIDPLNMPFYKKYMEEVEPKLLEWKEPVFVAKPVDPDNGITYEGVLKEAVFGQ